MEGQRVAEGQKGRGLGFQVNVVVAVGVTLMVAVIVSFVAYMSFDELIKAGQREKMLENKKIASELEENYFVANRNVNRIKKAVERQFTFAPAVRDRDILVAALQDAIQGNQALEGVGITLEPMVFDGKDAQLANQRYNDASGRVSVYVGYDGQPVRLGNYDTGEWYQTVRSTRQPLLTPPRKRTSGGVVATLSVPIEHEGQFRGVVRADIDLDMLQKTIEDMSSKENYYGVFTLEGQYLAQGLDKSLVLKNFFDTFKMSGTEINNVFQGDSGAVIERTSPSTGEMTVYAFFPMHLAGVPSQWAVFSATEQSVFTAVAKRIVWVTIGIAVFAAFY